jgi:hypothetical protein
VRYVPENGWQSVLLGGVYMLRASFVTIVLFTILLPIVGTPNESAGLYNDEGKICLPEIRIYHEFDGMDEFINRLIDEILHDSKHMYECCCDTAHLPIISAEMRYIKEASDLLSEYFNVLAGRKLYELESLQSELLEISRIVMEHADECVFGCRLYVPLRDMCGSLHLLVSANVFDEIRIRYGI